MKLISKVFDRAAYAQKRYGRLNEHFVQFLAGAAFLTEPASPVKGLAFSEALNANYFDAFFLGMQIRFRLHAYYGSDDALLGKVVVVREVPTFSEVSDIIGSFSFNGQGTTDFEVAEGADNIEMKYSAAEIILHFLDLSLGKPLP